jgi:single-strand selective monofunctional uracil DNA glycosylase
MSRLSQSLTSLHFGNPVSHVYNPLEYAKEASDAYMQLFAQARKRVLFVGMNGGPYGQAQTGDNT